MSAISFIRNEYTINSINKCVDCGFNIEKASEMCARRVFNESYMQNDDQKKIMLYCKAVHITATAKPGIYREISKCLLKKIVEHEKSNCCAVHRMKSNIYDFFYNMYQFLFTLKPYRSVNE